MADEDIESGGQTDDTGDTGVDETDDAPADVAEPVAAKTDGDAPAPRAQRRVHHMRAAAMAKAAAEKERDELRQRIAQMEQDHRETRQRIEQREQQTRQQDTTSQTKEKVSSLRDRAWDALAQSAVAKDRGDAVRYRKEYERLQDEANELLDNMRDSERWQKRQGEIQQSMPNTEMLAERQYFEAKYPWVSTSVEGRSLADGRFNALVRGGRPSNRATMEEAITYAAKALRLGGGSAPSDASRQRYAGFAGRDGEADDGAQSGSMSADEVKNDLALKRMALGLFREDDPEVAYAKFAKTIGSKAKQQAR